MGPNGWSCPHSERFDMARSICNFYKGLQQVPGIVNYAVSSLVVDDLPIDGQPIRPWLVRHCDWNKHLVAAVGGKVEPIPSVGFLR